MNMKWMGIIILLLTILLAGCSQTMIDASKVTNTSLGTSNPIDEIEIAISTLTPGLTTIPSQAEPRSESTPQVRYDPALEALVEQAREDLAQRLNISNDQITLLEANTVVWPDASLGCPQPDMVYQQIPLEGVLILLKVGEHEYEYHSGGSQNLFLCVLSLKINKITPNTDKIIPPPIRSGED